MSLLASRITAKLQLTFFFIVLSAVSIGFALNPLLAADSADRPPNIVLLLTDDHPFDQYGFMGSEVAHTPNIDQLASKSVRFVNGYVPSSVCRPSLGVLLTGLYPHQSGIWFNRAPNHETNRNAAHLVEGLATLPRLLEQRGYKSLQTGKHWEGDYRAGGFDEGTTRYIDGKGRFNGVAPDGQKIGRDTLEPIYNFVDRQVAQDNPFFVWYGVYLPHAPADAPERYRDLFDGKGLSEHEVAYHANIARLDESIGQLMGYFDRKGLTEDTVFVLVSDNGMTIHPDPWWGGPGGKTSTGEMGLRTPILVRWDGHLKPQTQPQLVSSIDIVPTLLDVAGVPREDLRLPGENLIELAERDRSTEDRAVFGELYNPNPTGEVTGPPSQTVSYRWVRRGDWKLIVPENLDRRELLHQNWPKINDVKAVDHFEEVRLHDVANDPNEKSNLAEQHPDRVQQLRAELDAWWNPSDPEAGSETPPYLVSESQPFPEKPDRPNVLFITIDDMNDWVGCLGGHPDGWTPNIDRLADRGLLFTNAQTAAPVCNPSRAAFLSGLGPFTSGIYHNRDPWEESSAFEKAAFLPEHFQAQGYHTMLGGKVFHGPPKGDHPDKGLDEYAGSFGGQAMRTFADDFSDPFEDRLGIHNYALHWGGLNDEKSKELADPKVARWAADRLQDTYEKPFLMMVGFYRPHTPLTSPESFHDMFGRDNVALPPVNPDDLEDLPWMSRQVAVAGYQAMEGGHYKNIVGRGYHRDVVHSYLAACSFVDAQVGEVLRTLERSPHRDNTIVVLLSDHGWGVGERFHFKKWGLWEDTTHIPMIVHVPWLDNRGKRCDAGVTLLDLYPTLVDLCGIDVPPQSLDGRSLRPLLEKPEHAAQWSRPALTTFGQNNYALRTPRYRYIRWSDGSEELYDHRNDPNEWTNLAGDPSTEAIRTELARWLPASSVMSVNSDHRSPVVLHKKGDTRAFRSVRPTFAGQPITVSAKVGPEISDGVILSHGGQFCGYALYVQDGRLTMSVMDVPRPLHWDKLVPSRSILSASERLKSGHTYQVAGCLDADGTMRLLVDDSEVARKKAATLSIHPAGTMVMGEASEAYVPVGRYEPPYRFSGQIESVRVEFGSVSTPAKSSREVSGSALR